MPCVLSRYHPVKVIAFSSVSESEIQSGNRVALPVTRDWVRQGQPTCFLVIDLSSWDAFILSPLWTQHSPSLVFQVDYVVCRVEPLSSVLCVFKTRSLIFQATSQPTTEV